MPSPDFHKIDPPSPGAAWLAAASQLAEALEAENRVLQALDFPQVAAALAAKQQAMAAATGIAAADIHALSRQDLAAARALAARLGTAAAENRRLLERAMAVQRRMIALVVRAAQSTASTAFRAQRYGGSGTIVGATAGPMALSARA